MNSPEIELRALMLASQDGDATAHRALLERLSRHLRAYYKGKLARTGRGTTEAEIRAVAEDLSAIASIPWSRYTWLGHGHSIGTQSFSRAGFGAVILADARRMAPRFTPPDVFACGRFSWIHCTASMKSTA